MSKVKIIFSLVGVFFFFLSVSAKDAKSYYEEALISLRQGNNKQAVLEFEKAIESNPLLPDSYYGLGIAYLRQSQPEKSRLYFNRGISIDRRFNPEKLKAEELLIKCLKPYGFSEDELQEKFLNTRDMEHISRSIIYKKIADKILKDKKLSVIEKAETFFDWTVRNISQSCSGREDYAAFPIDIMIRGYGVCDRSSWVLVTLARQVGIKGNIFYLIDPAEKTSPHTVALVYIDDKWCVLDPYKEIILKNPEDSSLVGIDEILGNPSLIEKFYPKDPNFHKAFDEGIFWIPGEPRCYFPKMAIIEEIIQELTGETPRIHWDLTEETDLAIKTFLRTALPSEADFEKIFFSVRDKKVRVGIWFYPFGLEQYYFSGKFLANIEKNLPHLFFYKEPRLDYLQGGHEEAISKFEKLMKISFSRDFKEDIHYFLALATFEKGDNNKTYSLCKKYLKEYPEGKWKARVEKLMLN